MPQLSNTIQFSKLPALLRSKYEEHDVKKVVQTKRNEYKVWLIIGNGDRWYFEDGKWWYEVFYT